MGAVRMVSALWGGSPTRSEASENWPSHVSSNTFRIDGYERINVWLMFSYLKFCQLCFKYSKYQIWSYMAAIQLLHTRFILYWCDSECLPNRSLNTEALGRRLRWRLMPYEAPVCIGGESKRQQPSVFNGATLLLNPEFHLQACWRMLCEKEWSCYLKVK